MISRGDGPDTDQFGLQCRSSISIDMVCHEDIIFQPLIHEGLRLEKEGTVTSTTQGSAEKLYVALYVSDNISKDEILELITAQSSVVFWSYVIFHHVIVENVNVEFVRLLIV